MKARLCSTIIVLIGTAWLAACDGSTPTITSVSETCSPTTIQSGQTSQCTATVQGMGNFSTAVAWTASAGTIATSGLYTGPTVTAPMPVTITATSVQDATKSSSTTLTINPIPVTILSVSETCSPTTIQSGQTSQCTATVQGTGNFSTAVTWTASPGTIATSGLYTAPTVTAATPGTITATSVQDPTKSGSTTLTVNPAPSNCPPGGQPAVILNTPTAGATQLSGYACNVDTTKIKVVIYALTNQWYVQPYVDAPFTNIASDGSWANTTNPWSILVVLLVDPSNYSPAATEITNPALDPNVLAWTVYPPGPISVSFSGRTWGIKVTGNVPGDQFDPGPNFWSNDPSVVSVGPDGLHLNNIQINGIWQCGEVYLTESLGYGTYTVRIASRLDQLDHNTVAAPLFIYAAPGQELDNEYSGAGGLIPSPNDAQFVVQPYTVPGNIVRYVQPSTAQFTSQMEWHADHVTFLSWNGWASVPAPSDIIDEWTYTGAYIPPPGKERVRINVWLLNGAAPISGTGDGMIINSFSFQP